MTSDTTSHNGLSRDPAAIEADILRQREELARTVDALSRKLDVKTRAQDKVSELKDSVTTDSGRPQPTLVLGAVALVASAALVVWWRHRS